ncbi:hypothetical protein GCM10010149_46010 [Nonomuraea roseoviolacea subsp. roseoviolacea]|uniref:Mycothiol-dependent maleylpyruvate isomerase metal-binding domain-containing protein n=1 Tax=Nonomuraea roseoviolacea subsp. carminata TaxID=160689 RepID=A0ABT1KFQ8_9ACTN|nr:maleylpyruvate isomerase N-terminal domain-containing protein [Nonomuraea roseoviolacea]MCP2352482.1 hypothetical protein [Nonomuraea roseoviolacea subsp. carminata]
MPARTGDRPRTSRTGIGGQISSPDAVIAALRTEHDRLAGLVPAFGEDDLARPSGAAERDVSQVLGHLGSGAEIRRVIAATRP